MCTVYFAKKKKIVVNRENIAKSRGKSCGNKIGLGVLLVDRVGGEIRLLWYGCVCFVSLPNQTNFYHG